MISIDNYFTVVIKKIFKKALYWAYLSQAKKNYYQSIIRNAEWDAIKDFIEPKTKFLDVGCGTGFILDKAIKEKKCEAIGIDPYPDIAGVKTENSHLHIIIGNAELLPFPDASFDTVYSSHVLEHVNVIKQSINEFKRVVKKGGKIIIIVPTAALAWINLFSGLIFTQHLRIIRYILHPISKSNRTKFIHIFSPYSHGKEDKTVFYDIKEYKIKSWKEIIEKELYIKKTILPFLYSFPDYIQIFKAHKNKKYSSSVAFICEQK